MKGLSIEEKARRYDEAKLRMSRAFNSNRCSIEFMNEIFPELRESEDERFKEELKEVLDECLNVRPQIVEEKQYMRLIAWLEKQAEQKPLGFNIGDEITVNGQICKVVAVEQKPAEWNEKDDSHIYSITEKLKGKFEKSIVITKFSLEEDLSWLKSLKSRVQSRQEWSEEDEKKLLCICAWIKDYPRIADFKDEMYTVANNYIDWLKSLRPKSQWKPSDEQMDALRYVTNFDYGGYKAALVSLYEQLKKLREE